jgi:CHASE1-domain containing sensor protein
MTAVEIAIALAPLFVKMVQNAIASYNADEETRAKLRAEADAEYEIAKAKLFGFDAALAVGDAAADAAIVAK